MDKLSWTYNIYNISLSLSIYLNLSIYLSFLSLSLSVFFSFSQSRPQILVFFSFFCPFFLYIPFSLPYIYILHFPEVLSFFLWQVAFKNGQAFLDVQYIYLCFCLSFSLSLFFSCFSSLFFLSFFPVYLFPPPLPRYLSLTNTQTHKYKHTPNQQLVKLVESYKADHRPWMWLSEY